MDSRKLIIYRHPHRSFHVDNLARPKRILHLVDPGHLNHGPSYKLTFSEIFLHLKSYTLIDLCVEVGSVDFFIYLTEDLYTNWNEIRIFIYWKECVYIYLYMAWIKKQGRPEPKKSVHLQNWGIIFLSYASKF